jgi:hypothetical protein
MDHLTIVNTLLILFILVKMFPSKKEYFEQPDASKKILLQDSNGNLSLLPLSKIYSSISQAKAEAKSEAITAANAYSKSYTERRGSEWGNHWGAHHANIAKNAAIAVANTKQPAGDYLLKNTNYRIGSEGKYVGNYKDDWIGLGNVAKYYKIM